MTDPQTPKYVFVQEDLSAYERIDPRDFPDYDDVDSRVIEDPGAPTDGD